MSVVKIFKGKVSDTAYIAMLEAENNSNIAIAELTVKNSNTLIYPSVIAIKAQLMECVKLIHMTDKTKQPKGDSVVSIK